MAKLFHFPLDPPSRAARIALREYGAEIELIEERPWEAREGFIAMNPAGLLPVFVDDDGVVVAGAEALREYLAETRETDHHTLIGHSPAARAEARRLTAWTEMKFHHEVSAPVLTEMVVKRFAAKSAGGGAPNMSRIRAALVHLESHFSYFSGLIEARYWLAGEHLSIADITAAAHISCLDYLGKMQWNDQQVLKDWYQRIKSRPSFRPLLADHVRGITAASGYAELDF